MSEDEMKQVHDRVLFEVKEGIAFADAAAAPSVDELLTDVYTTTGGAR